VRFERLAEQGRAHARAGRHDAAVAAFTDAMLLWRGEPLAEVADAPFAGPVVVRLVEARLDVAEQRCAAEIELGRHAEALADLDRRVVDHPLRERLVALRMLALAGLGRTADAVAEFERARVALADELGVDPSTELRDAHLAVLCGQV